MSNNKRGAPTKLSRAVRDGISNFEEDPEAETEDSLVEMIRATVEDFIRNKLSTVALATDEEEMHTYIQKFVDSLN